MRPEHLNRSPRLPPTSLNGRFGTFTESSRWTIRSCYFDAFFLSAGALAAAHLRLAASLIAFRAAALIRRFFLTGVSAGRAGVLMFAH